MGVEAGVEEDMERMGLGVGWVDVGVWTLVGGGGRGGAEHAEGGGVH